MSAATASPLQFEGFPSAQSFDELAVPVPNPADGWCKRSRAAESRRLFRKTLCASVGFHLVGLVAGWLVLHTYFPAKQEVLLPQAPEYFDISIVPLSAFETVLPKGAPVEKSVEASPIPEKETPPEPVKEKPQPPEVVVPKKKLESPKQAKQKPEQKPEQKIASGPPASSVAPALVSNAQSPGQQPGFVNGTGPSNEKARLNYQEAVASLLARAKRYPERALRRGVTGEATIRIEIRADGSLAGFEILRSAGASVLDEELRSMVDRASPFPSFPGDLQRQSLALVVPVAFTIK